MKKKVAIWVGVFEKKTDFLEYIKIHYTEDGDSIDSFFEQEFNLQYYDRDLMESSWKDCRQPIKDLLSKFSYSETFDMAHLKPFDGLYNCGIVIYDFLFTNGHSEKAKMIFVDNIEYDEIIEDRW